MSRNIELKARCANLDAAHGVARSLGAQWHDLERQRDTYFPVAAGRLKLRQRWSIAEPQGSNVTPKDACEFARPSQLIWYHRCNDARARPSDYSLVEIAEGDALYALLAGALGVAVAVTKVRTVYLFNHVRIHLDQVTGLGTFLEFEAIVGGDCDDQMAEAKIRDLRAAFQLQDSALCGQSYSDLLAAG